MKTVTAKIKGGNSLLGKFAIERKSTSSVSPYVQGLKKKSYEVEEGQIYFIDIIVYGDDDQKYKLEVTGADEADYPTSEITLDGGYDNFVVRIKA
ncbi:MAG: hypothetical protein ACSHW0_17075 [Thalassotalea sp.]